MKRKYIDSKTKNQKRKIQKKKKTSESLLKLFDFNIIQQIFTQLTLQKFSFCNEEEDEIDHFLVFACCSSFSSTCKTFHEVSKSTLFEFNVFQNETIQNISFTSYLKFNFMKQQLIVQEESYYRTEYKSKEEVLNDMLIFSSNFGFYDMISQLIKNGAKINFLNRNGQSALHCSCNNSFLKTSKELINHRCCINYESSFRNIPLHFAAQSNNLELVKYLVSKGSYVFAQNNNIEAPISYACSSGNLDIVKYLVSFGIDIHKENINSRTILYDVCRSGDLELLKYVVSLGIDINHSDYDGWTSIFTACELNELEFVKYLISEGADLSIKYQGQTLLEFARIEQVDQELIEELEKHFSKKKKKRSKLLKVS